MPPTFPTLTDYDNAEEIAAHVAILEAITRAPDPAASLQVTTWILDEMASTFYVLAFAEAADECAAAGTPHPSAPGPGGSYDDAADAAPEPDGLRDECQRQAVLLYAAILAAPGGYDPAPAVLRWTEHNVPTAHWRREYPRDRVQAAARCWGHYAVMSAIGHGVCWEDNNEPLSDDRPRYEVRAPGGASVAWRVWDRVLGETHLDDCVTDIEAHAHADTLNAGQDAEPLPAVSDLAVSAEAPTWEDDHVRAMWAKADAERGA